MIGRSADQNFSSVLQIYILYLYLVYSVITLAHTNNIISYYIIGTGTNDFFYMVDVS